MAGAALAWWSGGDTHALGPNAFALHAFVLHALVAYAAVVASFIGAIHWGFGFARPHPGAALFLWGVLPSIVACLSLLIAPAAGLAIDAVLLAACYGVDRRVYPRQGAAEWLALRRRLTVIAVASCGLTAWIG